MNTQSLFQSPIIFIVATGTPMDNNHVAPPLRRLWVEQLERPEQLEISVDSRRRNAEAVRSEFRFPAKLGMENSGASSGHEVVNDMNLSNDDVGHNGWPSICGRTT